MVALLADLGFTGRREPCAATLIAAAMKYGISVDRIMAAAVAAEEAAERQREARGLVLPKAEPA